MHNNIIASKWRRVAGEVKAACCETTDDELARLEGSVQQLAGSIQERYGKTKEQAEMEVQDFRARNRNLFDLREKLTCCTMP
ncbi:CsbD family protein [Achromobacter insolitus]|uniref:CsbD family protein n=1 Tax=Achromobacter insolitus TaxID=217204 RepID=UPI0015818D45|nr:CsbD family protein [Achromobacter insolitus]